MLGTLLAFSGACQKAFQARIMARVVANTALKYEGIGIAGVSQ